MKRRSFIRTGAAAALGTAIPMPVLSMSTVPYRSLRQDQDVVAVTGDGREVVLRGSAIRELDDRLLGRVLLANRDGYDEARRVLNPSFDRHPALIAQVTGIADIRLAVDFAREHSLLLAVKCGGHSASGKSTCDRGMMIDLSPFRGVHIDPAARRARVTGGSLLGQLDHDAMAFDLVTTMGTVSHTGVGGLVTGGGFGRVGRRFGLAIDNLVSVDVVSADGQLRHASAEQEPDLFWGVRGGGGNFGIVTSFEFQLHPMQRQVIGGAIVYPIARAKEALAIYADYLPQAPDELDLDPFMSLPGGNEPGVVGFSVCWSGPAGEAERALAPIRRLGTPLADVQAMDYVALQKSGDISDPRARAGYLKSGFLPALPPDLITALVEGFEGHPTRSTIMFIQPGGGAIGRVSNEATAFSHRDALGNLGVGVDWPVGDDPDMHVAWIRDFWTRIEPFTRGFYSNDGAPDMYTESAVTRNYRGNLERLVGIKRRYDPDNLFRLNANIQPG
ncbi:MAG TPA: FAD-binding protein [Longimicrobiales bacterium]|nr:FAD-binding protein [Longimicrobiales bacterium]